MVKKAKKTVMSTVKIQFFPEHPPLEKTHFIETNPLPILEQEKPFEVRTFCTEFENDAEAFFSKYVDKRFEVTGIAKKIGPDAHNKPSIELTDALGEKTYALVIFPNDDHYAKVSVGDTVVVRANYLVMTDRLGIVMKLSELLSVEKV